MLMHGGMSGQPPGISLARKIILSLLLTVHLPLLVVIIVAALELGFGAGTLSAVAGTVVALTVIAMTVLLRRLLAPLQTAGTHIAGYLAHRQLPPQVAARDDEAGRLLQDVFILCALIERQRIVLEDLALLDPLTGINNRRGGAALLARDGGPLRDPRKPLSVGMIDVDNLRDINAGGGHAHGDQGLRRVAFELEAVLRVDDFVARWGGDEFLVVCHCTESDMATAMNRVRQEVAIPGRAGRADVGIRISVGVAQLQTSESLDACIVRADTALYEAKRNGGDQVCAAS